MNNMYFDITWTDSGGTKVTLETVPDEQARQMAAWLSPQKITGSAFPVMTPAEYARVDIDYKGELSGKPSILFNDPFYHGTCAATVRFIEEKERQPIRIGAYELVWNDFWKHWEMWLDEIGMVTTYPKGRFIEAVEDAIYGG